MRLAKYLIVFVSFALVSFLITVAIYLGAFKDVQVTEKPLKPLTVLYTLHIGPYHKINEKILEVEKWAAKNGVTCKRTFGEFLNDPRKVDEDLLRSHAGCVVTERPDAPLPGHFQVREISFPSTVQARFDGSPSIGPFKVYPEIQEFFTQRSLRMPDSNFEFYEVDGRDMTTTYVFPIKAEESE